MADYRDVLGWPVGEEAEGIMLQLGCGVGAVEFAVGRGRDVIAVLRARGSVVVRCSRWGVGSGAGCS